MKFFLGSMKDGVDHEQLYEKLKKTIGTRRLHSE